jgi:hypothetical protein
MIAASCSPVISRRSMTSLPTTMALIAFGYALASASAAAISFALSSALALIQMPR